MVADLGGVPWNGWRQTWTLAWRDAIHEWPVSLCLVLALAAVLAPLLVLFGLKSGIVTTMRERLKTDPRTVEITLRGHYRLEPGWIEALRARPEVGFVIPRTRSLSATMSLESPAGRRLLDVDMIPTAQGDPLLPAGMAPPGSLDAVLVTETLAGKLGLGAGDSVTGSTIGRTSFAFH